MAEKKSSGIADNYANKFFGQATESAANTLTFAEINTGQNIFDKRAWILHRIEWYFTKENWAALIDGADALQAALVSSNQITSLNANSAMCIDLAEISIRHQTAVGFGNLVSPYIRDFSTLPGGGLIISARPLYVAVQGASLAAAQTVRVRGYFSQIDMTPSDYLDLLDFYRLVQ
jgi:hypothetical protein